MNTTISRFREGDEGAFDKLFHTFWDAGLNFVQSFLPKEDVGEDIVQEVFVKIWDKRQIFENEKHFKAYFYRALKNNTLRYITRNSPALELSSARSLEGDDFFRTIVEVEFNREVSQAIENLPKGRREIILKAMAGLTVEEIAESLNISVNTVKTQKKRAYAVLRDELKDVHLRILFIFV
ncbi:sigma-70 family RNA polymerase sigma factor [Carboxylicivirga sp. A043]|uniref:RNA polymerase sigma factor n=1 Tax=Carboxylicivirga litoralis TaxID=2816963 RepID=UPI0021CAE9FB|nr:sigma-70 family RNA polymerase sigma factor [Carboxylicivirga sp. A043]MCU4158294.1 sigma-70 family RNA polymerase sigma factor [Carboxylicivirga sp. A043]